MNERKPVVCFDSENDSSIVSFLIAGFDFSSFDLVLVFSSRASKHDFSDSNIFIFDGEVVELIHLLSKMMYTSFEIGDGCDGLNKFLTEETRFLMGEKIFLFFVSTVGIVTNATVGVEMGVDVKEGVDVKVGVDVGAEVTGAVVVVVSVDIPVTVFPVLATSAFVALFKAATAVWEENWIGDVPVFKILIVNEARTLVPM